VDRFGLWFVDENDPEWFNGSFDTGEDGAIRDERQSRVRRDPKIYDDSFFERRVQYRLLKEHPTFNDRHEVVGEGDLVIAPIWDGTRTIGALSADNRLSGRPRRQWTTSPGCSTAAGDGFIRRVAAAIEASRRSSDLACRMGGDEFMLVLPDTSLSQAEELMNRLVEEAAHSPTLRDIAAPPWTAPPRIRIEPFRSSSRRRMKACTPRNDLTGRIRTSNTAPALDVVIITTHNYACHDKASYVLRPGRRNHFSHSKVVPLVGRVSGRGGATGSQACSGARGEGRALRERASRTLPDGKPPHGSPDE